MWISCKSVFPNTSAWEQEELNNIKKTDEEGKKRSVSMDRSKTDTKKKEVLTAYHYRIKIQ